jgi:hypothetical protein
MKAIQYILIGFAMVGIFFTGILLHEAIHILQAKEPLNACWNIGQNTFAFVEYNITAEKHATPEHAFKQIESWENIATTIQWIFTIGLAMILGYMIHETRCKK